MKNHKKVLFITYAAVIAALYTVLTYYAGVLNLASGVIQVRFSEALTILAAFTPAAIPGLYIGCIIANLLTPESVPLDAIFGSLATLIGAVGTYLLTHKKTENGWKFMPGKKSMFLAPLPPVLANTIIVPFILAYVYQFEGTIPFFMLTVGVGEILSCYVLGVPLYSALVNKKDQIFLA
ncbi:MAG: QueT transporter family protein [Lachnospiraceae bacterium]|nr:QueT transporter family protein [Clostridiales bacterium]MBP3755201.1 QueT transporter family protein [Lachnospiraceae bacterium]